MRSGNEGDGRDNRFLQVASHRLSLDQALDVLLGFARGEAGTLQHYDFGGQKGISPSDGVTLEDTGRMTLMNPGLYGSEVAALLSAGPGAPWDVVSQTERLQDANPDEKGGLWDRARLLFDHFDRIGGIGLAKASKLLHIKRPYFYPVLDSFVVAEYGCWRPDEKPDPCWAAVRNDLLLGATFLARIRERLNRHDEAALLRQVSDVRLLDILAWSIHRFGLEGAILDP
jgi:hypothetical protein